MPRMDSISVEIGIPYVGKIEGTWTPDERQQAAAWELYVELTTRVAIISPKFREVVVLRETLSSLHSLFGSTRYILRQYGPVVARTKGNNVLSVGYLAITILNSVLRPFLSKWHPQLSHYEALKPPELSPLSHEQTWESYSEFNKELRLVQKSLYEYAKVLAEAAKVPLLITEIAED